MKIEFDPKNPIPVARMYITGLMFLALFQMYGWQSRESQQIFFVMGIIVMTSLFMKNIYLTGFVIWTVVLYGISKFTMGQIYLSNIFFGTVLYLFSRVVLKDSEKYLKVFMMFVALNMLYAVFQAFNYDWIYKTVNYTKEAGYVGFSENNQTIGFMSFQSAFGMLLAIAIPVVLTRAWRYRFWMAVGMFVGIYLSSASIAVAGGMVGFLLGVWNHPGCLGRLSRYKRQVVAVIVALFVIGGIGYMKWKDDAATSYVARLQQWKIVLQDCQVHPVIGWGLDSFRNVDAKKTWQYAKEAHIDAEGNRVSADIWDNPHNMWVSLQFEWGFIGVLLVFGYLLDLTRRYLKSWRLPNQTALYGILLGSVVLGTAHFPLFLARFMVIVIPVAAMLENSMEAQDAQG